MLEPVHVTQPAGVSAQWSLPLVNVGVFELLRQKASPRVVCWSMSPLPLGSANSHVVGSPRTSPSCALRPANPSENLGVCPAPQRLFASVVDPGLGAALPRFTGAGAATASGGPPRAVVETIRAYIACSLVPPVNGRSIPSSGRPPFDTLNGTISLL